MRRNTQMSHRTLCSDIQIQVQVEQPVGTSLHASVVHSMSSKIQKQTNLHNNTVKLLSTRVKTALTYFIICSKKSDYWYIEGSGLSEEHMYCIALGRDQCSQIIIEVGFFKL